MTFKDHFSQQSDQYRRYRPDYPRSLFAYLAEISRQHRLAWDCATGSGQAAVHLADHYDKVIATDASQAQLANAQTHAKVQYRVCSAECSCLESASVDLITVAQAVHWFDLNAFAAEAQRVLKPGALLAVWNYGLMSVTPQVDQIINYLYRDMLDAYWPPERAMIENNYRDITMPFAELDCPDFTMYQQWSLQQLAGYLKTWSAVKRYQQDRNKNPVDMIMADLIHGWHEGQVQQTVSWPMCVRVWQNTINKKGRP